MGKAQQQIGGVFEKKIMSDFSGGTLIKIETKKARGHNVASVWLDFAGWIDGQAFTFDAKWVGQADTFARSRLTKKQQGYLDQALATGAWSFALVGCVHMGIPHIAIIPWAEMPKMGSVVLLRYVRPFDENWVKVMSSMFGGFA